MDSVEIEYLIKDSVLVKRKGDTLFFTVSDNKKITLINVPEITISPNNDTSINDVNYAQYSYLGFNKDIEAYLVYGSFYEWVNFLLIDKRTGDTTVTCQEPTISPNKEYFICGNSSLSYDENFNGLEFYKNSHKPILISSRYLEKWGPAEIKWLDNNSLLIKCDVLDSSGTNFQEQYLKLHWK